MPFFDFDFIFSTPRGFPMLAFPPRIMHRHLIKLACLLLVSSCAAAIAENVPAPQNSAESIDLQNGMRALESKDYPAAVAHLTAAVGRDPANSSAQRALGKALTRSGNPGKAVVVYTEAIRLNPSDAIAYAERAQAQVKLGDKKKAIDDLGKAIELQPENPGFRFVRGSLLSIEERYDEALDDFSAAILSDPNQPESYFARGTLRQMRGESRQAIADFDQAISLRPKFPSALANRAISHLLNRDFYKVSPDFDAAVALNPRATDEGGYGMMAWFLSTFPDSTLRDGKKAMEYGRIACELSEWKEPRKLEYYAAACAEAGDFEEAIRWQTKALELMSGDSENSKKPANTRLSLYQDRKPFHEAEPGTGIYPD